MRQKHDLDAHGEQPCGDSFRRLAIEEISVFVAELDQPGKRHRPFRTGAIGRKIGDEVGPRIGVDHHDPVGKPKRLGERIRVARIVERERVDDDRIGRRDRLDHGGVKEMRRRNMTGLKW